MMKPRNEVASSGKAVLNAVPFLQPDAHGRFHVSDESARILSQVKGKLVIVAVAGPYRTGKSFLLNRLIDAHGGGFKVGNTINACTKGIWLWGEPIYDKASGRTYVFLDTEGLNSTGENVTYDTQIFALSVLLSSVFIFNTLNTITESALEELELVAECSKMIRFRPSQPKAGANEESKSRGPASASASSSSSSSSSQLPLMVPRAPGGPRLSFDGQELKDGDVDKEVAEHFPSFIWVLRDFTLALQDKAGHPISANEYLENTLKPLPANFKGAAEKNRIRKTITSCFLRRECRPLVRPVDSEADLRIVDSMPRSKLRPEFEAAMRDLRSTLHDPAVTPCKVINDAYVSGDMLVGLAREYCEALNTGRMPEILSAWQSVLEIRVRDVTAVTLTSFKAMFDAPFANGQVLDTAGVHAVYQQSLTRALADADVAVSSSKEAMDKIKQQLVPQTENMLKDRLQTNEALSTSFCREVYLSLWDSADAKCPVSQRKFLSTIKAADISSDNVAAFVGKLREAYRAKAKGPSALEVERDWTERVYVIAADALANRTKEAESMLTSAQAKVDLLTATVSELEQKTRTAEKDLELAKSLADQTNALNKERIQELKQTAETQSAEAAKAQAALVRAQAKESAAQEQLKRVTDSLSRLEGECKAAVTRADKAERDLANAKAQLKTMEEEVGKLSATQDKSSAAAQAKISLLTTKLTQAEQGEKEARAKVKDMQTELKDVRTELTESLQQRDADLKKISSRSSAELHAVKEQVVDLESQLQQAKATIASLKQQAAAAATATAAATAANVTPTSSFGPGSRQLGGKYTYQQQQQHQRGGVDMMDSHNGAADDDGGYGGDVGADYGNDDAYDAVNDIAASISYTPAGAKGKGKGKSTSTSTSTSTSASTSTSTSSAVPVTSGAWELPYAPGSAAMAPTQKKARASVAPAASATAFVDAAAQAPGIASVADLPLTAEPVRDPKKLTIMELKSWLTSIDVPIPQVGSLKKQDYINLLMEHDPRLRK